MSHHESSGHFDLFAEISDEGRSKLFQTLRIEQRKRTDFVWRQGDVARFFIILIEGQLLSRYESEAGKTGALGIWSSGDLVGLGDFVSSEQRRHSSYCITDTRYLVLPFNQIQKVYEEVPQFRVVMLKAMSIRLRWMASLSAALETHSAPQRIASVFLLFAERFGKVGEGGIRFEMTLSDERIAALTGVTRQFVNVTIHQLVDSGLVFRSGKSFLIPDMHRLEVNFFKNLSPS